METTERDLRQLERRIERLEHLVVQALAGAATLALGLGSVLSFLPTTETSEEDDVMPRLLTTGFHAIGYRTSEGEADGFSIALGIGFLGLMLVAAIAICLVLGIASQAATERTTRLLRVANVLLVVGTSVVGLFALVGLGSDEVEVGWGVVVFAAGVVLCLVMNSSALRAWWDPTVRTTGTRTGR